MSMSEKELMLATLQLMDVDGDDSITFSEFSMGKATCNAVCTAGFELQSPTYAQSRRLTFTPHRGQITRSLAHFITE